MRSGYTSSSAYYAGTKDQQQQGGAARAYPVAVSVSQKPSSASSPLLMHCSSNYSTVGISGASDPSSPLNGVPATPAACSPRGKQEPTVAVYGPSVPVQHPQFVDLATNMCSLMPFALTEDEAEEAREAYHTYPAESGRARQVSTDGSFLCDDGPAIPHSPPTAPTSTYTAHSHAVFPSQRAHLPPPQKPLQVPEEMPATAKARHSPVPSARRSLDATPQHQATTLHHDTNPSINHLIFVTNADGARICLSHPKGISPQELGSPNVSEMAGSPAEHATTMMGLTASTLSRRPVAPSREVREEEDEVFVSASQNAPQQLFSNESLDCSVELGMPQQQQQRRKEVAERRKEPVRRGAAVAEPVEKATATTDDSARRPEREKTRRQRGSKRGEGSESAPAAAPSSRAARQNADGAVSSRRDVAPPSSPLGHDIGSPRRAYTVSVMGHRKAIAEVHSHASWGVGTYVMFDGDRGMDMGRVVSCVEEDPSAAEDRKEEAAEKGRHPNKTSSILREANEAERIAWTVEQPEEAAATLRVCREAATQLRLPLTVVDAVYQYNKQKLTFYYASNDRVDFRQLLQTLFLKFHCRIWMERVLPEEEEREVAV